MGVIKPFVSDGSKRFEILSAPNAPSIDATETVEEQSVFAIKNRILPNICPQCRTKNRIICSGLNGLNLMCEACGYEWVDEIQP